MNNINNEIADLIVNKTVEPADLNANEADETVETVEPAGLNANGADEPVEPAVPADLNANEADETLETTELTEPETQALETDVLNPDEDVATYTSKSETKVSAESEQSSSQALNTNVFISNVFKSADENGAKRDKTSFEVVLVKTESGMRMASVFFEETKTVRQIPVTNAEIGDVLDGGRVVGVKSGQQRRLYATKRITIDELDLSGLEWMPRHKNRKPLASHN